MTEGQGNRNIADHIQILQTKMRQSTFLQGVYDQRDGSPLIFLYTDEQLIDMTRFGFTRDIALNRVIGIDKTFNLTNFHLTVTCYKNLSLLRKSTREHPLFIGPMLIHGNSRQRDFREFFGHLNGMIHERGLAPGSPETANSNK